MNKQRIPPVDPATAIGTNKKNFDILESALGFIPNMALAMAQSPAALDGYMGLSVALIKGRLGKRLGEELALTLAGTNRCEYCASAHSTTAKIAGLDEADVVAALQGESEDVREAAALKLARSEAPDKQVEELMQQVIAGRERLFQQGYPDQSPVQKAIRKLAAKLDVTSADNGQNTRQNSTIPFSL